ncbi:MAG: allophanate hydrolase subunit 1 [Cyclobacteriaceae bacterium]
MSNQIKQLGDIGFEVQNVKTPYLLQQLLKSAFPDIEIISGEDCVTLYAPNQTINIADMQEIVSKIDDVEAQPVSTQEIVIPCCYDPTLGFDINAAARALSITPQELIHHHTSNQFQVQMMGFIPGFGYLSGLPDQLKLDRKTTPLPKVPKGSVAISRNYTCIYPQEAPGGWHIIGRTPISIFKPMDQNSFLFSPGTVVSFRPISIDEFNLFADD